MSNAAQVHDAKVQGLIRNRSRPRDILDIIMTGVSGACIGITLVPLFAVLLYVLFKGASRLNLDLFTKLPPAAGQTTGGIASAILGTIQVVALAMVFAVPFGVMAAVFVSEFSSGKIAGSIRFATNVLSGVPSIIAGVFIYSLIVLPMKSFSVLAGALALAVLMLPTIVRTTDEALKIVPQDVRSASVGLGAANYQTALQVVLPAALPAILTGVTLAIARAAGETAPLLFTVIYTNNWPSGNPLSPTLPSLSYLVYEFARGFDKVLQEFAWAGSLVLVFLVLMTSILARWATRQKNF
ncbi:MAG: phosphate ABC transporter permease PstA [Oscillatoriales cyanobacterium RM2_1_1]|nr:phosphate ABC transporter permease PstA [Oscillatoriales cyanobacterium SM2_3_0]NJO44569.1 phosphate ABC transporter permease PstA [Oscillatoriales cyanobacterium RM2_1_1]